MKYIVSVHAFLLYIRSQEHIGAILSLLPIAGCGEKGRSPIHHHFHTSMFAK